MGVYQEKCKGFWLWNEIENDERLRMLGEFDLKFMKFIQRSISREVQSLLDRKNREFDGRTWFSIYYFCKNPDFSSCIEIFLYVYSVVDIRFEQSFK